LNVTLNKMMIIGNLGADPELRYAQSGKAVATIRVAVNNRVRGADGEWQDETIWFRVITFDQRAERAAEQLRKGNRVYADGRLRAREWEGADGQKRTSLEIIADQVLSLERREREAVGPGPGAGSDELPVPAARPRGAPAAASRDAEAVDVDDIPF
jgi:single-strand DNA-binding protein